MDSNHRKHTLSDLQSDPFGHSGTTPKLSKHFKDSNHYFHYFHSDIIKMELPIGFEPTTVGLQNRCSTN